jgi:DNA-binding SARP family transcriptional activator
LTLLPKRSTIVWHSIWHLLIGDKSVRRSQMNELLRNPTLHIHLLGDFRLSYDDVPVTTVSTPRLQSLLAYLVLYHGAPQARRHLAFLFWPDSTEAQALTNLRNLLYHLRRALPDADHFLRADAQTLQWQPDSRFTLDVIGFRDALAQAERVENQAAIRNALEEALSLYQGDLLPSCYDDWLLSERERLSRSFIVALEKLILLLEDQRDYRTAIGHAQRLLRYDMLREETHRHLMQLHALTGDRAAALRAFHTCTTVLQDELGVEPSPATHKVYEQLLQTDEMPAPAPTEPLAVSPLVGRRQEWAKLQDAWRAASAGRPRFVLVTGEVGIGKTRLVEEMIRWAERQGIATATTRCYAAEGELAYAPVVAWLRARPLSPMEPVWRSEVTRLLPELLAEQPDLPPPGPLTEAWQRQRLFEALARAILGGSQPLLLLITALQWCDRETLEWLHYLLRYDAQARLLVVGTCRMEEMGDDHPLALLLESLRRDGQLTKIELDPLDETETASLVANLIGRQLDPALAACLYWETEGNPLFVVETVRVGLPDEVQELETGELVCIPRPLPSRVQDAVTERLAQLTPPARELAGLAATIGRAFTFPVLAQASDKGEDYLVRVLDELWQRRILREQGAEAYDFGHDKLREMAYASLSAARRRLFHRRVAQALESVYAHDLDAVSGQIAVHYERAGQPERAALYYRRAAEMARRMRADDGATRYHRRALTLLEKVPADDS